MANLRKCIVCGKEYEYCPRCSRFAHLPKYMFTYCSENCKEIDYITASYANGHITVEDAKAQLKNYDLTEKDNFLEPTKTLIVGISVLTAEKAVLEEETPVEQKRQKHSSKNKIVNDD